jgi:thioredoxin 2
VVRPLPQFRAHLQRGRRPVWRPGHFAKIDTEAQPALGRQFNIRAIPTLLVFRDRRETRRVSGALPAGELDRLVREVIDQP